MIDDDRILCQQCRSYRAGNCESNVGLWSGTQVPLELRSMRLRCLGWVPLPGDSDQRRALERWPGLVEVKARAKKRGRG